MAADRILPPTWAASSGRPSSSRISSRCWRASRTTRRRSRRCLKSSVADVVRQQAAIGIDLISDGEFGKTHWYRYAIERFSGIQSRPVGPGQTYFIGKDRERFREFYAEYDKGIPRASLEWAVTSALSYRGAAALRRDIDNFKAALAKVNVAGGFLPVVAPASVMPELKNEFYASPEEFAFGLAEALRAEYKAITDAGLIVQIDDAWLPAMYERLVPPGTPDDYRRWASMCIDALNHALRGIPEHLHPLSHLLGQLERAAHRRPAAQGVRRPDASHQCRRLFRRRGEPAA